MCKRRVIHSSTARQGLLFCETWRSHTGVHEDYALSTGEGLQTFWWNVLPSSWTVGPEDDIIARSNYCSWPALSWRQRHYSPSKCWELLAQQHSITFLQTGIYFIRDSCWPRVLRSHVWDVTMCSLTGGDVWGNGIASTCMANPDT